MSVGAWLCRLPCMEVQPLTASFAQCLLAVEEREPCSPILGLLDVAAAKLA